MEDDAMRNRIIELVSDINSCQLDAVAHQQNFKAASNLAYGALQNFLKSKNMKTTDELVDEVIKELPLDQQQKIRDRMKELTPPSNLIEAFFQPSELAKFMLYGWLVSGASKLAAPYFYQAKSAYISWRSKALLTTIENGTAVTIEGKALAKLSQVDRQALLTELETERNTLQMSMYEEFLKIPYEAPSGAVFGSVETEKMISNIDKATKAIEKIGENEAKALRAAGRITIYTKVFIIVNVVAIIGLLVYDKVKETEIHHELEHTLKKVCTARLYARLAERMELTHTDQMSTLKRLAKDLANDKKDRVADDLQDLADQAAESLKAVTEQSTWDMLAKIDEHRDTRGDPKLCEMQKMRAEDSLRPLPHREVKQ